jgi:uncharacterized membrane protein YhdT
MNDNTQAPDALRGYREKHTQMNREAVATMISASVVMVFWWAAGFGLAHSGLRVFFLPLWFVAGSFGSWFLSIALVVFLTKRIFKNFSLEDDDAAPDNDRTTTTGAAR